MALFALCSSSPQSTDFIARKLPPTRTSGRLSSHSTFSGATARETARSKRSRSCAANSSARAWTHVTRCSAIALQTSCKNAMRLPRLSSSVRSKSGSNSRSGIPGKPAPVPTSTTRLPRKSSIRSSAAQSSRWSVTTSTGSVMAVRFITRFFSSSLSENSSSRGAASAARPQPLSPSRSRLSGVICPPAA